MSGLDLRRIGAAAVAPLVLLIGQMLLFPVPPGIYLNGIVLGLLGALVALGMSLVYRANRIINFSQSALGVVPTVVAVELIVYSGLGYLTAGLIGAVLGLLLGAVVYRVIIRRFADASRLVLTAATIGLAQLFVGISIFLPKLWGHETRAEEISSGWGWTREIDPLVFRGEHVIAAVVSVVALATIAFALLRTSVGAGVRASAERADLASLLGVPVQRLQLLVWATAALLSFVGMFLRVSIVGLPQASVDSMTALLAALAALTLGRFTHLARVAVIAIVLGIVEQAVAWNNPQHPQLYSVVLAVVILVGLLFYAGARSRAERDTTASWQVLDEPRRLAAALRRKPAVRVAGVVIGLGVLAFGMAVPALMQPGDQLKASTVLVLAMVGTSLVVLTGWAGQVSLGQTGFVAVGAALGAWLTTEHHLDLSAALVLAAVAGGIVAVIIGLPALRLRGLFLAVTTLAFSVATASYLLHPDYARWIPADRVERAPFLGLDLNGQAAMYWVCLGCFVASYAAARALRRGRPGRAMVAQREAELSAESYGMSTTTTRLTAFAVSGAIASVAGCLLAHVLQSYPEQLLTPDQGITIFTSTVVGGIATPAGGLIGALVLQASGWYLTGFWRILPTAVGVLLVLLLFPTGIAGSAMALRDRLLRLLYPAAVPDDAAPAPVGAEAVQVAVPATTDGALLAVQDLRVAYGDALVIDDVSFEVAPGATMALLGTNGAGKSTVLKAISGIAPRSGGSVTFEGRDITALPPHEVAALGIGQAPGGRGVFPTLTVTENLDLACWLDRRGPASRARMAEVLERFPMLETRRGEAATSLSGGEQQMLAIGMAYITGPRLLMIDELSLGLSPLVVEKLLDFVEAIRAAGTTVLIVEQSVNLALTITEEAIFLERGHIRFRGPTAELLERPDLFRSVYLSAATEAAPTGTSNGADAIARVASFGTPPDAAALAARSPIAIATRGATVAYGGVVAVNAVDLAVDRDEVVGIIGPNGAGKSTLLDAMSGLAPMRAGAIELSGVDITGLSFAERARRGLARSFQDARLFPALTVEETLAIACDRSVAVPGLFEAMLTTPAQRESEHAVRMRVDELIELLGLGRYREHHIEELSTGLRRVVDLAGIIADRPDVVLLDEPSSGLAQPEVEALGALLARMRAELALTIVIVEHDMPLAASMCDRLVAMDQGCVVTIGAPDEVLAHPEVVESYLGRTTAVINRSGPSRSRPATSPVA